MDENMDWNEELGQGTDGLEYDYTGALVEEARDNDLEVQAMHSYLEYLFLQKEGMFTELYNKDDTYIKRNRKYIRKILLLINPKWVDPDETSSSMIRGGADAGRRRNRSEGRYATGARA